MGSIWASFALQFVAEGDMILDINTFLFSNWRLFEWMGNE